METDPGMSSKFRKSHTLTWFSMRTFQTVHTLIYEKYWMCNQWDGYSTIHYSRVQYSTIQYCTVQYNTMLYSTVRYITPGEETTHTITHRPTISLCCPCVLCLLRRLSSSPPHRSKDQGCSFYIVVLLETKYIWTKTTKYIWTKTTKFGKFATFFAIFI